MYNNINSKQLIKPQSGDQPQLMVIVDTEEEFDWTRPFSSANTAVTSIQEQSLAHERIFEHFKIRPTYVVDYPVVSTDSSSKILLDLYRSGRCEIGTHLHPWVTPPHEEAVNSFNSYPGNLPIKLEREKLKRLTGLIEDEFTLSPIVYKAGRYGVGPNTCQLLEELNYRVDASVVPHTDFSADGGPDFTNYEDYPYWFGSEAQLLEIPLSVGFTGILGRVGSQLAPILDSKVLTMLHARGIFSRLNLLERIRLTPEGVNAQDQKRLIKAMYQQGHRVFSYTYHSSSLGIGNTPYVRDQYQLENFLKGMEDVFEYFRQELNGIFTTPLDYYNQISQHSSSKGTA